MPCPTTGRPFSTRTSWLSAGISWRLSSKKHSACSPTTATIPPIQPRPPWGNPPHRADGPDTGIGEGPAHRRTAHAGDAAAARPRRPRRHCRGPTRRPNPTRRRDLRHPLRRCAGRERHGHKWVDFLDCRYRRRPTQAGRASGKSHWRPNLDRITAGDCVRPLRGSVSCCHARSALPLRSLLSFARPMLPPGRPSRRGRAPSCPEPVAWRGSGRAPNGRRYRIEACEGHRLPPRLATRRPGGHPAASRPGRPATPPH